LEKWKSQPEAKLEFGIADDGALETAEAAFVLGKAVHANNETQVHLVNSGLPAF
jgi:hypothetical protein